MCTGIRFTDNNGHMYFGRNLDWSCGYGQHVVITPTGWAPNSPFGAITTLKHPVYGMGIVAQNTPLYFDCANDAGLAVAGLNFPGYAQYEKDAVKGKTNVCAWEFPLWVVTNYQTVDEVEEALKNTAIVDRPINEQLPCSLLHWIIGDATRSIVVEHMADGIHVYHDGLDVLANQPTFAYHEENVRSYIACNPEVAGPLNWRDAKLTAYGTGSCMRGIPGDCYSPSRFVRAAYYNAHYPQKDTEEENVSRLFHTLGGVSMVDGAAKMTDGAYEITVYTGGISTRTNTYYYNTYDDPAIKSVKLADYDTTGAYIIQIASRKDRLQKS